MNGSVSVVVDWIKSIFSKSKQDCRFEMYKGTGGDWRFRFKAANHEIVAYGEGYTRERACVKGIKLLKRYAPGAPVNVLPTQEK